MLQLLLLSKNLDQSWKLGGVAVGGDQMQEHLNKIFWGLVISNILKFKIILPYCHMYHAASVCLPTSKDDDNHSHQYGDDESNHLTWSQTRWGEVRYNIGSQWRRQQQSLVHQLHQTDQRSRYKWKPEYQVDLLVNHIDGEGAEARGLRVWSANPKDSHLTSYHAGKHLWEPTSSYIKDWKAA